MLLVPLLAGLLAVAATPGRAAASELIVFSSGAAGSAQKAMAAAAKGGPRIALTIAMPAALQARLAAGEKADVIVAPVGALDALERDGRLQPGTRVTVARVGVGVAVREGAARPDVSTVAALRAALMAAPSVVHPDPAQAGSVAGKAIARMLAEMGIAEALRPRMIYRQAIAGGVAMVAKGEAAIGLFNISEILPAAGVTLAGPLPKEVQIYVTFAAAVVAGSNAEPAARAYIRGLGEAPARQHWEAAGLEVVALGR